MKVIKRPTRGFANSSIVSLGSILPESKLIINYNDITNFIIPGFSKKDINSPNFIRINFFNEWCLKHHFYAYLFHVASTISKSGTVVEVGCGFSTVFLRLASSLLDCKMISIDIERHESWYDDAVASHFSEMHINNSFEFLIANTNDVDFTVYDDMNLFFYDGSKSVEHVEKCLLSALDVLVSGGLFIMHDFNGVVRGLTLDIVNQIGFEQLTDIYFTDDDGSYNEPEMLIAKKC